MSPDVLAKLDALAKLINHRITNGIATIDDKALLDTLILFQEEPTLGFSGELYTDHATQTGMYDRDF
jgi:hypothetical protein